jgi:hypothetical protein
MKKAFKVFLITFASLLVFLMAAIGIALWFVFTPEKLTPFVQKQATKYITCKPVIGEVELTFFSTFPNFGLKVNQFTLTNPADGVPNDTLVRMDQVVGIIDFVAWWKRDEVKIKELILGNGTINIFSDSLGNTNYNIFPPDTLAAKEPETATKSMVAGMENVKLENIGLTYVDHSMKLKTSIRNLTANMSGTYSSDILNSNINISQSIISVEYAGEKYLNDVSTKLNILSEVSMPDMKIKIEESSISLNDLSLRLNGSVSNENSTQNLVLDLVYNLNRAQITKLLAMVPPSYQTNFKGMAIDGTLTADGKITGIYNDKTMPVFDIHLLMENGTVKYEGFPLPLNEVFGDVTISTDGMTDAKTFVRLDRFEAKTPKSSFSAKGLVNRLFTDIYCDLTTDANLTLDEFNPMIPADMKLKMTGNAQGQVKSAFTMAQVEKMQIEKMKLSGSVTFSDFDMAYDSMLLKTDLSKIDFALPNNKPSSPETRFVFADITSQNLHAGQLDSYSANFQKAHLILETSDMRDSTRIPYLICSFSIDSMSAVMDTMSIALAKPAGKVLVSPRPDQPLQPIISMEGNSNRIEALMGKNSATMKTLNFDTEIVNHANQKDIFLQWLVTGFFNVEQCNVTMAGFSYPIEIPSVKMDFAPESVNIKEGKLKIDKSDFQLTGNLRNVLSYYRGDSILRGNFNFTSNSTDVLQLMTMTNGIGYDKENKDSVKVQSTSSGTGPYMVPKVMDISLNANVRKATFGTDTATNLSGNVRVYDGILLLDEMKLTTPAARMQLTSMYRTPRKNHLYLGLDYHLFDVEIEELLQMIPDIDSLMPMLRSFRGKGEFHMAVETYLDSMYNIKKSTLRGASSISGQNLVLMDGETFSEIAKKLMFNKKTVNRIDSLSAEFTIFRDEIDIYPFLIVMDKYKAVVAGRHNFDLSFDYHISVVDCPLPVKLGIDVKGTMDNMSYSLAKCKYAELYRPSSRKVVENKQLELRRMIREALTQRVKSAENN